MSHLSLKTLKWIAFVIPTTLTAVLLTVMRVFFHPYADRWWGLIVEIGGVALGAFIFSTWVFRLLSESEARIRRTGEYLQRLIEGSQDAIVAMDKAGRVVLWNAGAETLYGFTKDEAERHVLPMVPRPERKRALETLRALHQGHAVINQEDTHQRKDGWRVPVLITLSLVPGASGHGQDTLMIAKDLTEQKRAEAQRRRLALLEERQRIGMDIHDGAIQALYAVGLSLEALKRTLPPDATASQGKVSLAVTQLNGVIHDLRNYILDSRPDIPARPLREGLLELAERLRAEGGMTVTVDVPAQADVLEGEVAEQLLHIAGEAASNVLRHAGATRVEISLQVDGNLAVLSVADDGRGFDPEQAIADGKLGLRNMKSRTLLLGGAFHVDSAPGRGTAIQVEVPS